MLKTTQNHEKVNKKKRVKELKGKLQSENTLAVVEDGRRIVYIKGCYHCSSRFQATRSDALTCSERCRSALGKRLSREWPPLIRFDKSDRIKKEDIGDLGQYKKKKY